MVNQVDFRGHVSRSIELQELFLDRYIRDTETLRNITYVRDRRDKLKRLADELDKFYSNTDGVNLDFYACRMKICAEKFNSLEVNIANMEKRSSYEIDDVIVALSFLEAELLNLKEIKEISEISDMIS